MLRLLLLSELPLRVAAPDELREGVEELLAGLAVLPALLREGVSVEPRAGACVSVRVLLLLSDARVGVVLRVGVAALVVFVARLGSLLSVLLARLGLLARLEVLLRLLFCTVLLL